MKKLGAAEVILAIIFLIVKVFEELSLFLVHVDDIVLVFCAFQENLVFLSRKIFSRNDFQMFHPFQGIAHFPISFGRFKEA